MLVANARDLEKVGGLWANALPPAPERKDDWLVIIDDDVTWLAKATPWPAFGEMRWYAPSPHATVLAQMESLVRLVLEEVNGLRPPVVHAFVTREDRAIFETPVTFAGKTRLRIDRNRRMRRVRYHGPTRGVREGRERLACTLRINSDREPQRDTPVWFCALVEEVACECGVDVEFFTEPRYRETVGLSQSAILREFGATYLQQMMDLAANFDAAVGVTSGGLDLAAAAGLPILRVGEFQKEGYAENGYRVGDWGASFNAFLARDLNVGIPFYERAFFDLPQFTVRKSLLEFIQFVVERERQSTRPQHLLLATGAPFDRIHLQELTHLA